MFLINSLEIHHSFRLIRTYYCVDRWYIWPTYLFAVVYLYVIWLFFILPGKSVTNLSTPEWRNTQFIWGSWLNQRLCVYCKLDLTNPSNKGIVIINIKLLCYFYPELWWNLLMPMSLRFNFITVFYSGKEKNQNKSGEICRTVMCKTEKPLFEEICVVGLSLPNKIFSIIVVECWSLQIMKWIIT